MALDPEKYENVREIIRDAIDLAPTKDQHKQQVEDLLFEFLVGDLEPLIEDSRPPRLYIFGRSGAGKSSLINALANKEVADVGAVKPETVESEKYPIQFPDRYANWEVIDSRGLFESVPADGDVPGGTVETLTNDIEQYRPDILIHVMTPDQVRAGKQDFEVVEQLSSHIPGGLPPLIYCLNKIDHHQAPNQEWPPEKDETLSGTIVDNLDFVTRILDEDTNSPFKQSAPVRGYTFDSTDHIGVFPTYVKEPPYWNVETLAELMGEHLPEEAVLQFAQAQRRNSLMRSHARKQTRKASIAAGTIAGVDLTGVSDIMVLTPLQVCLVMLIGSFSCEEFSKDTAQDYFTELGAIGGTGLVARKLAGTLSGMIPGPGAAVNASIASAGTYAIGRSAEEYFFEDEFVHPKEYLSEAKSVLSDKV